MIILKICKVDGCKEKVKAKEYCNRHYKQVRAYGQTIRTRYDANEIIVRGEYAEVILCDFKGEERARVLIDSEDIQLIEKHKWCYKEGYAMSNIDGKTTRMHRFIMSPPGEKVIDHKNHDTLDNRKANLRVCTVKQNNRNLSNVKGIYYRESRKSWRAKIMVNGKSIYLGTYKNKEQAGQARRLAEIEYFGEFAPNRGNEQ